MKINKYFMKIQNQYEQKAFTFLYKYACYFSNLSAYAFLHIWCNFHNSLINKGYLQLDSSNYHYFCQIEDWPLFIPRQANQAHIALVQYDSTF